ncbi:MAG TPA: polyprenyl synthetase family protein [Acidimicrobiia bacterium]|nr:polyprenyl synthetase family protein [Acidimicrobiia bacterium]
MELAEALGLATLPADLGRVEAALGASVRSDDPFLTDIATHLIGAGGKRLRPMLALCAGYAARPGLVSDDVVTGAVAVELVHLGSLYHDDVIDEASTRRGVESVNARWSNIVAILAGDYLLARASSLAASLGVEVAGILADTIGELCKGQVLELQRLFDVNRDEASYMGSISGKTASLMASACRIGAIVAGLDRPAVDALTGYGQHVGMIFQIVDDVLDLTASEEELGKPAGLDLADGIYTLPVIYALRTSPELRDLLGGPLDAEAVAQGRALACANGSVTSALEVADGHAASAIRALEGVGLDAGVVDGLGRLAKLIIDRSRPAGIASH